MTVGEKKNFFSGSKCLDDIPYNSSKAWWLKNKKLSHLHIY